MLARAPMKPALLWMGTRVSFWERTSCTVQETRVVELTWILGN